MKPALAAPLATPFAMPSSREITQLHALAIAMLFSLATLAGAIATEAALYNAGFASLNAGFWIASLYTTLVLVLHVRRWRAAAVAVIVCTTIMIAGADLALTGLLISYGKVFKEANPAMSWTLDLVGMPGLISLKIVFSVGPALVLLRARDGLWTARLSFGVALACGVLIYAWAGCLHMLTTIVSIVTPPTSLPGLN